eukprot:SAG22_NODE_30_length_28348_cov_12.488584_14_plen_902_part_00
MNANVFGFDVRAAAKEQVEAVNAKFLEVQVDEDGSGAGGYAKEMSKEWFDAAEQMLMKEMADTNVVVTTALIPGRPAPTLITAEHVAAMPPGSVTVDLASEAGGNVATTVPGEVVQVGGVTCIGHTNFPARMAHMASQMFGGNVTKLLVSMDKGDDAGNYQVDLEDTAVRSMCVVHEGAKIEPYEPPPPPPKTDAELKADEPPPPRDLQKEAVSDVTTFAGVGAGSLAVGSMVPDPGMLSTFALSVWVGQGAVTGVAHALHSPLMSITNAISGTTIFGGMLQLGGGMYPTTVPQVLATTAVGLSAVNLVGGFVVTGKMLDMFRRPTDPPEYWNYYMLPPAAVSIGYAGLQMTDNCPNGLTAAMGLASGIGCVGGISAMSNQESSRLAPALAIGGVGMGLTATAFSMNCSPETYMQLAWASAAGGAAGFGLSGMIGPTQLPQAVAGFHSLVGVAATSTAVADFMMHDVNQLDGFHSGSIYMGAWMGAITTTGSIIACGKLAEVMDSKPMALPGRDAMNMAMAGVSAVSLAGFVSATDQTTAVACLATGTTMSGLLGFHMTASIGGADMPVVITLLNSYSGWALCAEGFILNQPVLAIVGSLIGSSGAFLTKIMCDGMNRSLVNVILGGFGAEAGAVQTSEGLVHTEILPDGVAESLLDADKVCIVPGYGLAVAQAQGTVASIANELTNNGTQVYFAVHPVAGRMPGQLNVLLAEAGVPYDQVLEMEEINPIMEEMDVSMVVGANDTVNSAAETDPNCDIAGMPVIQVWKSKQVVFFKRSMASGYAGVDNPVFYNDNTDMVRQSRHCVLYPVSLLTKFTESGVCLSFLCGLAVPGQRFRYLRGEFRVVICLPCGTQSTIGMSQTLVPAIDIFPHVRLGNPPGHSLWRSWRCDGVTFQVLWCSA